MKKIFKSLSLLMLLVCPLLSGCKDLDTPKKYEVTFILNHDDYVINEGFAVIGDFCDWGKPGESLSDDAIILDWRDNGLYRGERVFDEPMVMEYKLVKFFYDMIYNIIDVVENIPNRILAIESEDVNIHLEWEKLE